MIPLRPLLTILGVLERPPGESHGPESGIYRKPHFLASPCTFWPKSGIYRKPHFLGCPGAVNHLRRVPGYTLGQKVSKMILLRPLLTILGVLERPPGESHGPESGIYRKPHFLASPGTFWPKSGIYRKPHFLASPCTF